MNRRFRLPALMLSVAWSGSVLAAETNAPLFRESELRLPPAGKTGFTLLRPEQTGILFTNTLSEWASAENRVLNDGQGHFANATAQARTASPHATESLTLADIDGNGTLDLYVANNRNDDIRDWLRIPVMMVNKKPTVPPALRDRITFENGQLQE